MSPQLTLQAPLQLPPEEIPSYLEQLWSKDQPGNAGANTFCLVVWQPAWLEQQLVRIGKISGPIIGTQRHEMVQAARQIILESDLPHSTPPFDSVLLNQLASHKGDSSSKDLRGQHIDSAISALQPRRLITLAPTLNEKQSLETLVAAYCPLPEEGSGQEACGDAIVLRGNLSALNKGLNVLQPLLPSELPSWVWWNGSLDEANDLFDELTSLTQRLVIDTSIGDPSRCLHLLKSLVNTGQAVSDLNWLRLRSWRETLAMVFDPPCRRSALNQVERLDIDIEGDNPVQGLLLAAWIADRLNWKLISSDDMKTEGITAKFQKPDESNLIFNLIPLPVGKPSMHPGQIVGIRMICKQAKQPQKAICVILAAESGECMRLEAGGMASMELLEEVVPIQVDTAEMDVARLLASSRGSTSPLLASAAPIAAKLLSLS